MHIFGKILGAFFGLLLGGPLGLLFGLFVGSISLIKHAV